MKSTFRWHALALALVLPSIAIGQVTALPPDQAAQEYYPRTHAEAGYTPADMVMQDGFGRTGIFEILNLTPYTIRYTTSSLSDQTDRERHLNKAFMFAPVGLPSIIPPGATGSRGTVGIPGTHPRMFVLSWNDYPGTVEKNPLNWVVQDVDYLNCIDRLDPSTCTKQKMNVYLGLWLSRVAPPDPLKSDVIADIFNIVNEVTSFLAYVVDPLNPLGWWAMFSSTYTMTQDPGFLEQQKAPGDGRKMYVSTYPLPNFDRECFQKNNSATWVDSGHTGEPDTYFSCTPGTMVGESSDGYKAQWADTDSGPAPAEIVVLTSVVRGKKVNLGEHWLVLGSVPQVMITVMTATQYEAGTLMALAQSRPPMAGEAPGSIDLDKEKVVKEVRKFRDKYGIEGSRAALTVIAALAPSQRDYLREAVLTLLQRKPISKQEEKFLLDLIKQSQQFIQASRKEG